MKVLKHYKNGNYTVSIYEDGTKVRSWCVQMNKIYTQDEFIDELISIINNKEDSNSRDKIVMIKTFIFILISKI